MRLASGLVGAHNLAMLIVQSVFLSLAFGFFGLGAWRLYRGQPRRRPPMEFVAMAALFAVLAWQALSWLSGGHGDATAARHVAVWIQLVTACGITVAALASAWLSRA